jgi:hypothetical protein
LKFIIKNIKWVMLISGALTSTMFFGLFAPEAALQSMFGVAFNGTLEVIVVRSWSALIGLMGVVLMYGAFSEKNRVFAISIASTSKAIFVALVLLYGSEYLGKAMPAIAIDCILILLTVALLVAVRIERPAA